MLQKLYKQPNENIIANMYISQKPIISLEVFPPKENFETKMEELLQELSILKKFNPSLISVTYGAGGSTQDNSFALAKKIKEEIKVEVMPHFTCVEISQENIEKHLNQIENAGFKNILALRGDIPQNQSDFSFDPNFQHASDLVKFIKERTKLSVGVAGYPEGHKEAASLDEDIKNLKIKVDCGAEAIFTQVFFDNTHFFRFVEKAQLAGINIPIIPGILAITNPNQIQKMAQMCGCQIPKGLLEQLERHQDDKEAIKQIGIEFATYQCQQLSDAKVKGIHFYTLNKASSTEKILENLL